MRLITIDKIATDFPCSIIGGIHCGHWYWLLTLSNCRSELQFFISRRRATGKSAGSSAIHSQEIRAKNTCKNVLVDLKSCVGIFCCIILSPQRLHCKFPHHSTYSDWLNWNFIHLLQIAEVSLSCKISPATLEPQILDVATEYCLVKSVPAILAVSSCLPSWWTKVMYYQKTDRKYDEYT